MLNIELSNREIAAPGLYIMRRKGHTGLVRIVGQPKTGYTIISPPTASETYFKDTPKGGAIPDDALFSEPLTITQA